MKRRLPYKLLGNYKLRGDYMTKDVILREIINLRDRLSEVKFQLVEENNSDEKRHLNYYAQELESDLKIKMDELNQINC